MHIPTNFNNIEVEPKLENVVVIRGTHSRSSEFVNNKLFEHFENMETPCTEVDIDDLPIYFMQAKDVTSLVLNLSKFDEFVYVTQYLIENDIPEGKLPLYSILYPTYFEKEENIQLVASLGDNLIPVPFQLSDEKDFFHNLFARMHHEELEDNTFLPILFKKTGDEWSDQFQKTENQIVINGVTFYPHFDKFHFDYKEREIEGTLSKIPMRVFAYLVYNSNKTICLRDIAEFTYGKYANLESEEAIRVYVTRIRKAIEVDFSKPEILITARIKKHGQNGYILNL